MKVKSQSEIAQSCPTLCDPMDYSLPGSSVHGIFQATTLEWCHGAPSEVKKVSLWSELSDLSSSPDTSREASIT